MAEHEVNALLADVYPKLTPGPDLALWWSLVPRM